MSEEQYALNEEEVIKPKRKKSKKKDAEQLGNVDADSFTTAIAEVTKENMIDQQTVSDILIDSMKTAYLEWSYPELRDKNNKEENELLKTQIQCKVVFTEDLKHYKIYDLKVITPDDEIIDDAYQISPEDYYTLTKKDAEDGTIVEIPFDVTKLDKWWTRRVKQLFNSKLKEASKQAVLTAYKNQMGGLIEGKVIKADNENQNYEFSFGKATTFIKKDSKKLLPNDRFTTSDTNVLFYLEKVSENGSPTSLDVNRTSTKFVEKLMEREIPEVGEGIVKVKGIAREPGRRCKVFVESTNPAIDPVGTCIGPEASRQRSISTILRGEKLDFCKWHPNKAMQIMEAMKPADVIGMTCPDDFFDKNVHFEEFENDREYEHPQITVIVNNGGQGVAIGSNGSNVRLASHLSKCKLTVLQIDDAMKQGIKFMMVPEILRNVDNMYPELAVKPVEATTPAAEDTDVDEEDIQNEEVKSMNSEETPAAASNPEEKVVEEVKPVEKEEEAKVSEPVTEEKPVEEKPAEKKEEEVEHIEIMNKPKISLDALEAALTQKKGPSETRSYRRKKREDEEEKKEVTSEASKATAMPIYTQEELDAMDEQAEDDDNMDYEDDDELDQYYSDKYYGDDSGK